MIRILVASILAIATYLTIGFVFYAIAPGVAVHHVTPVLPIINSSLSIMVILGIVGGTLVFGKFAKG